jgi:hypothetical protein
MDTVRRTVTVAAVAATTIVWGAGAALAQTHIDPTVTPEKSTGGWVYGLAVLIALLALGLVIFLTAMYMRYAPRFSRDEESKVVYADRVMPGKEPPRRAVDLSQAVPIVVQPPAVPAAVAAVAAPAAAAPAVAAPAAAEPAAAEPAPAPAAAAPAPAPAAPAPAPAAPAERVEVSLDQETFDRTLEELLAKGTDRRVAEGQARRAAMIAARKKAAGEG